jgi:hypothetical protein
MEGIPIGLYLYGVSVSSAARSRLNVLTPLSVAVLALVSAIWFKNPDAKADDLTSCTELAEREEA